MSLDKALVDCIISGGLYKPASVEREAGVPLSNWSVREIPDPDEPSGVTHHFVGRNENSWDGRVSSKIVAFDRKTKVGVTSSSRGYQLIGPPGKCSDGEYVWNNWMRINNVNREDVVDVSDRYK